MRNSFLLNAGNGEKESVLWVAAVLLLCLLNFQTDSGVTGYVFQHYVECKPALDEVDKKPN